MTIRRIHSGGIYEQQIGYCWTECGLIDPKYRIEIEVMALAPE